MADPTEEAPEHALILGDIHRALKRTGKAKYLEAAKEFSDECYPLMAAMTEHFAERMERFEEALDSIIEQTDSFLQPDLTQQIMSTLELGKILGDAVLGITLSTQFDEVSLKRLHSAAMAYATAYEMTTESVEEAAVGSRAEGGDAEEGEGEEDDEEEGVTFGVEVAPSDEDADEDAPAAEVK
jgi:hypothetical protein